MENQTIQNYIARGIKTPSENHRGQAEFCHSCCKLDTWDVFDDLPDAPEFPVFDCVEVRFKNNRKDFFKMGSDTNYSVGEVIAVEASPGHDVGIITLMGHSARKQMKAKRVDPANPDLKKVYRKAKPSDIEKWYSSIDREWPTMRRTRNIIRELNLDMKLNDVEYQGDGTKAIFFYTAEERVDFRELIKLLAEEFKIRIEMRQIGARQEAGKLGGIGSCGRELCCATFIHNFQSVSTNAARVQQLSFNPQKLTGQCSKLKCCLNYEFPVYNEILKNYPDHTVVLKTRKGDVLHQKTDIFKDIMWYSYANNASNQMALSPDSVRHIISMNRNSKYPETLEEFAIKTAAKVEDDVVMKKEDIAKLSD